MLVLNLIDNLIITEHVLTVTYFTASQLFSPKVQQQAPDFKGTAVVGETFKDISLSDYKGKYLVLVFYPLDL